MRFLYPVRIVSGENVIVTSDGNVTIPTGTYYTYSAPIGGADNDDYPSLFYAIFLAAQIALGVDVLFSWSTPDGYDLKESVSGVWGSGLSLNFSSVSFTFPPELLGFPSDIDSDVTPSAGAIIGTRSSLGAWISGTIHGTGAQDRRSTIKREAYASTDPIYKETKIITMRDRRNNRAFRWEWVPGLRVQGGSVRGTLNDYRETAGVGEITDSFADDGDEMSLRPFYDRVSGGQTFLVLYGDDDQIELTDGLWEAVRISELSQMQDFEEWYTMTRPNGEFYDVGFDCLRVDGGYDY